MGDGDDEVVTEKIKYVYVRISMHPIAFFVKILKS